MTTAADPKPAEADDVARMWDVMENERTVFLITQNGAGPHARPMWAIVRKDEGCIWFLTDKATAKDDEIEKDGRCALVFTNGGSTHLAVTGSATIVDDRRVIKDLWTIPAKAFFPDGPEDTAIVAIRVAPVIAELWDGPSAPIALVQMAAALVTGKSAADMGRNVEARLD